jgi:hypothetical protein
MVLCHTEIWTQTVSCSHFIQAVVIMLLAVAEKGSLTLNNSAYLV